MHPGVRLRIAVIVTSGVQQSMQRVEKNLAACSVRCSVRSAGCAAFRSALPASRSFINTDGNVNINSLTGRILRKCQHIGGGIEIHVSRMQHTHAIIMHQFKGSACNWKAKQWLDALHGCHQPGAIGCRK